MLRMNVAPNVYAKGSWVVHLFAGDGEEHIHQLRAASATNAARMVLEAYEASQRAEVKVVSILSGAAPDQQWR